ncbi:FadR/GntR family transcriptional regulator [Corallococcus sp. EGB]|uniref:FadR/GntR family transcriptional regulator n=1 Tax=Corallococcus sp. EGB TaxID=1521117 RepID=UPI00351D0CB9
MAYIEAELERDIALGRLPPCGQFGSEVKLARRHHVCRGTIREALRRLAARGLVVQRPGRRTRAVALDESLTLENLGLALHDARSAEARWLLEGYFSLRRQVMVELLVDCCAKASQGDLNQLSQVCFGLWDAGKWESGERCAQVEFELLRLAARVAERPGHVLLVQSLQRAFLGAAARLLPFMGGDALREWAIRAMNALSERDVRALQQDLPMLMTVRDERVLEQFARVSKEPVSHETHRDEESHLGVPVSATPQADAMEAVPGMNVCGPGWVEPVAEQSAAYEVPLNMEKQGLGLPVQSPVRDERPDARPCREVGGLALLAPALVQDGRASVEADGLGHLAPVADQDKAVAEHTCVRTCGIRCLVPGSEDGDALGVARCLPGEDRLGAPEAEGQRLPSSLGLESSDAGDLSSGRESVLGSASGARTSWRNSPLEAGLASEVPPVDSRRHVPGVKPREDGLFCGTWGRLGRWVAHLLLFVAQSLGAPAP